MWSWSGQSNDVHQLFRFWPSQLLQLISLEGKGRQDEGSLGDVRHHKIYQN